jgi:lysophospholipid acyltransferase (LPLAT)-like uncharacterized protein
LIDRNLSSCQPATIGSPAVLAMLKLSVRTRQLLRRQKPPSGLWRLCALAGIQSLYAWMSTLNYRMYRHERQADPAEADFRGPNIYIFWHEYIPFPVYIRHNCRLAMLVSQHQDAELLSHMARFAGLDTVRGSSSRGGTAALRELIERGKGINLAITPDGPRGPRRKLAQGCIYLSSRLQIPLVPIGIGYDRPWRNPRSWDQFAVPRPFSRCRAILGPRIQIAPELDRQQLEWNRQWVEHTLTELTVAAEQWAESKINVAGSEPLWRRTSARAHCAAAAGRTFEATGSSTSPPTLRIAS